MVAWVAASGGIAEDVRLRKRASRSLTKTGFWGSSGGRFGVDLGYVGGDLSALILDVFFGNLFKGYLIVFDVFLMRVLSIV